MNIRWMMRAKRLAQSPPSWGRVKFVMAIIAVCIVVFLIERYVGWPDWAQRDRMPRRGF